MLRHAASVDELVAGVGDAEAEAPFASTWSIGQSRQDQPGAPPAKLVGTFQGEPGGLVGLGVPRQPGTAQETASHRAGRNVGDRGREHHAATDVEHSVEAVNGNQGHGDVSDRRRGLEIGNRLKDIRVVVLTRRLFLNGRDPDRESVDGDDETGVVTGRKGGDLGLEGLDLRFEAGDPGVGRGAATGLEVLQLGVEPSQPSGRLLGGQSCGLLVGSGVGRVEAQKGQDEKEEKHHEKLLAPRRQNGFSLARDGMSRESL